MGVLDIAVCGIAFLFAISGFIKGFMKQVFSILAWAGALVVAFMFCNTVAKMISDFSFSKEVTKSIYDWFASKNEAFTLSGVELTSEYLGEQLKTMGIPTFLHKIIIGALPLESLKDVSVATFLSEKLTSFFLVAASFVGLYLVSFIIIKIIASLLKNAVKGNALSAIDGILGLAWGAVKAGIIISVLFLIMSFLVTLPFGQSLNEWLIKDMKLAEEGFGIAKYIYQNNPILLLLDKLDLSNILKQSAQAKEIFLIY